MAVALSPGAKAPQGPGVQEEGGGGGARSFLIQKALKPNSFCSNIPQIIALIQEQLPGYSVCEAQESMLQSAQQVNNNEWGAGGGWLELRKCIGGYFINAGDLEESELSSPQRNTDGHCQAKPVRLKHREPGKFCSSGHL